MIRSTFSLDEPTHCTICKDGNDELITCERCHYQWCDLCRIQLYFIYRGLHVCPHCYCTNGSQKDHLPFWIEDSLQELLHQYDYESRKQITLTMMDVYINDFIEHEHEHEHENEKKKKKKKKKKNRKKT
jgi:hypothetical protein